jgi:hypothetical protein
MRRQLRDAIYAAVRHAIKQALFFAPRPLVVQVLTEMAAEQAELLAREHSPHSA